MDRRTFLAGMLAAPAVVSAGNIWIPPRRVIAPPAFVYPEAGIYEIRLFLPSHIENDLAFFDGEITYDLVKLT